MTTKKEDDGFPWVGEDIIHDDGERTDGVNLWNGKIVMKGYTTPVMVKKGGTEIKKSCYDMMKKFQHNSCIPHLEFYMYEKNKMGRLVVPIVKASFDKWVRNVGQEHLFDENGAMSTSFRTMMA
ncbi:hypothetical protein QOZ80_3AG0211150 [Eleusine coracana subsp. coracana]|nr:hypothetical protein QOZ80_3AG0211150 [Eleusine coracana subsp. coracana]